MRASVSSQGRSDFWNEVDAWAVNGTTDDSTGSTANGAPSWTMPAASDAAAPRPAKRQHFEAADGPANFSQLAPIAATLPHYGGQQPVHIHGSPGGPMQGFGQSSLAVTPYGGQHPAAVGNAGGQQQHHHHQQQQLGVTALGGGQSHPAGSDAATALFIASYAAQLPLAAQWLRSAKAINPETPFKTPLDPEVAAELLGHECFHPGPRPR
eukprot:SAG22_NODE_1129_length_5458_cov_33.388692_3_plen_210_part_00